MRRHEIIPRNNKWFSTPARNSGSLPALPAHQEVLGGRHPRLLAGLWLCVLLISQCTSEQTIVINVVSDAQASQSDTAPLDLQALPCPHAPSDTAEPWPPTEPTPTCASASVKPWYPQGQTPGPTLDLQLGRTDPVSGVFTPWQDGDWAPIIHGVQGGIHIPLSFVVVLPSLELVKMKLLVQAQASVQCQAVALGPPSTIAVQAIAPDFGYRPAEDVRVIFTNQVWTDSPKFCGQTILLQAQLQEPASGQWGQAQRWIHLYDTGAP